MTHLLIATLPLPPSVNHAYMTARGGHRRVMLPRSREWMAHARDALREHMRISGWTTAEEKTIVECFFVYPCGRRRDTHNFLKLLCDSMESAGVVSNDCLLLPKVNDYVVKKGTSEVHICVYPIWRHVDDAVRRWYTICGGVGDVAR